MKKLFSSVAVLLAAALGGAAYVAYRDALIPVPLVVHPSLYTQAAPEFGEDAVLLEALLSKGSKLDAFLRAQTELALLERTPEGSWAGPLLTALQRSRHGRRWRLSLNARWLLQDGTTLDSARVAQALPRTWTPQPREVRIIDAATLELRWQEGQESLQGLLGQWRIPGSGPFLRNGGGLLRFERSPLGRSGVAGLRVVTDPALLDSRAWAQGLSSARWAWAVYPGHIAPEDMAKVRLAPYDALTMKDGTVWFVSRRLRRFRPDPEDWTRTRLFGVWKGAMDLPYEADGG